MATTIHLPDDLLKFIDRKAKKLNVSRNKFIRMLIEKESANDWPQSFIVEFSGGEDLSQSVESMGKIIKEGRTKNTSKGLF